MKRKLIFLILTAAVCTGCLAGCQSSTSGQNAADPGTSEQESVISAENEFIFNTPESNPLIRNTEYGPVSGMSQGDGQIYYHVPYGANPTGDLRWAAPAAPESWNEVLDCSQKGELAMQQAASFDENGNKAVELKGTTDCLNMDIYTRENAAQLPVFVYLHGGNNQTGDSGDFIGSDLVNTIDCVVVSVNYRLGFLGFNCLPALQTDSDSTGNYALLDMAMALSWIRSNIASFGGDSGNVTVTGFSAGGRDVMAMLVSPAFEGLFDKAIAFSGGMTIADEDASAKKIAAMIAPLAVEDGKYSTVEKAAEWLLTAGDDVKDYLYHILDERLTGMMEDAGIRMSAFPHLYGDDVLLPSTGFEDAVYCNDVPIMMLTGETEFSLFCNWDGYLFSLEEDMETARTFAKKYGSDFYRIFNTQLSAGQMYEHYNSDIYLCQINYGGDSSPTKIPDVGSFHGVFVPMLSTQHTYGSFHDFSQSGFLQMASLFQGYLKNFLYTGSPNANDTNINWTAWTKEAPLSLILDADELNKTATAEIVNVFKTNQEVIDEMEADTTLSDAVKEGVISHVLNGRWFSADLDSYYGNTDLWNTVNQTAANQ